MKYIISLIFLSFSFSAFALDYVPGEVIVKLKGSESSPSTQAFFSKAKAKAGMKLKASFSKMKMYHYKLNSQDSVANAISELEQDPNVDFVEPNYIVNKATAFNNEVQPISREEIEELLDEGKNPMTGAEIDLDVDRSVQSYNKNLGNDSEGLQKNGALSAMVPVVAVIDTGLDIDHDVFVDSSAVWENTGEIPGNGIDDDNNGYVDDVNGWNYVDNTGNMYDDEGHGTHVSGIVLGSTMDIFASPVETSVIKIMPLKFLDSAGSGKTSDAISAIYYAVQNGAHVINNSWGGPGYSKALHDAVTYTYEQSVVFTAAAGNSNGDNDAEPLYPSSYDLPHVMSVAATDDLDQLAGFSNFGTESVDLGSPGVFIRSTLPCTAGSCAFGFSSGTSMATPFVSGAAALMLIEAPTMMAHQVKEVLFGEADFISDLQDRVSTDSRVNINSAVTLSKTVEVQTAQPNYVPTNTRQIASTQASNDAAGGGCGTVKDIYRQKLNPESRKPIRSNSQHNPLRIFLLIGVLMAPFVVGFTMRSVQRGNQTEELNNRRQFARYAVNSAVSLCVGGNEVPGLVSCISAGGAKMLTGFNLDKGGIVNMKISSPCGNDQIQVDGQVVWSGGSESYGIQFKNAGDEVQRKISDWTRELEPEPYKKAK